MKLNKKLITTILFGITNLLSFFLGIVIFNYSKNFELYEWYNGTVNLEIYKQCVYEKLTPDQKWADIYGEKIFGDSYYVVEPNYWTDAKGNIVPTNSNFKFNFGIYESMKDAADARARLKMYMEK